MPTNLDSCNFNEDSQDTCFRAFNKSNSDGKESKLNEAVQMSMSFKVLKLLIIKIIRIIFAEE